MSKDFGDHTKAQTPADRWLFLKKFFKHGTTIASVSPSSRFLVRALLRGIDFAAARCIIELGAGTGPVTAELLRRAPPGCRVLIVERDPDFCRRLRERFPAAEIIEGDATDFSRFLTEQGMSTTDHIISGLPFGAFPPAAQRRLVEGIRQHLAKTGTFRQITEIPWVFLGLYKSFFREVRFHFVLRNIPPSGFYVCQDPL